MNYDKAADALFKRVKAFVSPTSSEEFKNIVKEQIEEILSTQGNESKRVTLPCHTFTRVTEKVKTIKSILPGVTATITKTTEAVRKVTQKITISRSTDNIATINSTTTVRFTSPLEEEKTIHYKGSPEEKITKKQCSSLKRNYKLDPLIAELLKKPTLTDVP